MKIDLKFWDSKRKEDIPLLTTHFMTVFCKKMGKPIPKISSKNIDRLMRYAWPGNVRELSHYIERAVIMTKGNRLKLPGQDDYMTVSSQADQRFWGLDDMLRNHITDALARCHWKVSGKELFKVTDG